VTYIDLESLSQRDVAETFSDFLNMLKLSGFLNTIGILDAGPIETTVARLNVAFGVQFDNLSSWEHGYPMYRWPLGGNELARNWAWLSPNRVPLGFVRESDPEYAELVGQLPGTALRFPEYPDVELTLTHSDGAADRVKAACATTSLRTRPIP
jgi:hypothetical protein